MTNNKSDILNGMKAICDFSGRSEATIIKWHRELNFPVKKTGEGRKGPWVGSRCAINKWIQDFVAAG